MVGEKMLVEGQFFPLPSTQWANIYPPADVNIRQTTNFKDALPLDGCEKKGGNHNLTTTIIPTMKIAKALAFEGNPWPDAGVDGKAGLTPSPSPSGNTTTNGLETATVNFWGGYQSVRLFSLCRHSGAVVVFVFLFQIN